MVNKSKKMSIVRQLLKDYGGAVIAFSGGVDSTFLAKVAREELGENLLAVTASSEIHLPGEKEAAQEIARKLDLKHRVIATEELSNEQFAANSPERCYFCKKMLFGKLLSIAKDHGLPYVLDGANYDDQFDHRPGMRAGRELGIKSPLLEAGLTKDDIRDLSRQMGLPDWDKPSQSCLSSRFPYGERITSEKLSMVRQAEEYLGSLGIKILRVRHHGQLARIEVIPDNFHLVTALADEIEKKLNAIGYRYVTLDLKGFRSGSMNEVMDSKAKVGDDPADMDVGKRT